MTTLAVVFTLIAVAGLALAAALAAAESSLVTPDPEPPSPQRSAAAESAARERQYRALSFARLGALLVAGASGALVLRTVGIPGGLFIAVVIVGAILVATVTEGASRTLVTGRSGATRHFAPLVRVVGTLFAPMGGLDARVDRALATVLPPLQPDEAEREATDQFREIVSSEASVTRDEADLITGVFSLGETPVRDVMIPRVAIVALDRAMPWSEMLDRVRSSEHARFPVFEETLDEVVGVLFAKDLLHAVITDTPPAQGWQSLLREPTFIPATKPVDQQLRDFQAGGTQIAIVVDEYGGTAGLVTIEDILEEIVGEIRDEYDEEDPPIEMRDGRRYWVSGRVPVDELGEALNHQFQHEESSTVGGLIYERLGRVPRSGEQLTMDGFRVVVERVVRRRVERVYFERVGESAGRGAR